MGNDDTKIRSGEKVTEDPPPRPYDEEVINLGEYFAILRKDWWKIVLFSLAVGLVTLLVMFLFPNIYQATAVLTPAVDEKRPNPALGILASLRRRYRKPDQGGRPGDPLQEQRPHGAGVQEIQPVAVVLTDKFDSATGKMKFGWTDRVLRGEIGPRAPGDWDAIRAAKDRLNVFVNKKVGTVSVSFESPSAEGSANIVKYYLDEGKTRLQEEAFDRASKNKKFIEEQIGKTVDALTRDRLYMLYGQEVEREMMGRNREQFGFRIIDSPRIPDRKSKPERAFIAILSSLSSFLILIIFWNTCGRKKTSIASSTSRSK